MLFRWADLLALPPVSMSKYECGFLTVWYSIGMWADEGGAPLIYVFVHICIYAFVYLHIRCENYIYIYIVILYMCVRVCSWTYLLACEVLAGLSIVGSGARGPAGP